MALSKFLDPKNDYAFKRIFGTEKNQDILIDFINAVVGFSEDERIKTVSFLKPSQDPEIAYKKQSMVDVLCRDQQGRQCIIEMQVARTTGFEKRAQYYAAKAYAKQLNQGDDYEKLKQIIFVAITDFVMFPDKVAYHSTHCLLDDQTYSRDLHDFSFTFLELPKFKKSLDELENNIERWVYFFKHADETKEKDIEIAAGDDPSILRAFEELNRFSWTENELDTYEAEEKRERDERSVWLARLQDAEKKGLETGLAEGLSKGLSKGIAEGLSKGIAEGLSKGMLEEQKLIAKNLLRESTDLDLIVRVTGLSISEIKKL